MNIQKRLGIAWRGREGEGGERGVDRRAGTDRDRESERDLVDKEREWEGKSEVVHYITKSRWDKLTRETRLSRAARRPGDRAPPLQSTERKVSHKNKQTDT